MITKIVSETERSTTVQATTELTKVKFNDAWNYYAIRNDGSSEAYVSKRAFSNTTEDGVISIPAQGVASIPASVKSIYITGSGSVLVLGQNTSSLPFRVQGEGGESGGGSGLTEIYRGAFSHSSFNPTVFDCDISEYTAIILCPLCTVRRDTIESTTFVIDQMCPTTIIPIYKIPDYYNEFLACCYPDGVSSLRFAKCCIKYSDGKISVYSKDSFFGGIIIYGI